MARSLSTLLAAAPLVVSRLFQAHEAAARGDLDGLRAAGHAELFEEMPEVRLDRTFADAQLSGDFLVRLAVGEQPQRRQLARRELDVRDAFSKLGRRGRRQVRFSG